MQTVLLTAREIASAMEYLHACEIIHGKITPPFKTTCDKPAIAVDDSCNLPSTCCQLTVLCTEQDCGSGTTVFLIVQMQAHVNKGTHVVPGDLCGGNVLLTTSKSSPHGFTVKVADFVRGLPRFMLLLL